MTARTPVSTDVDALRRAYNDCADEVLVRAVVWREFSGPRRTKQASRLAVAVQAYTDAQRRYHNAIGIPRPPGNP